MSRVERVVTLGQGAPDDIVIQYPKQWVALEVLEERLQLGPTKGRVIAHGRKSAKERVVDKLVRFRESDPDKEVALFYTGPMIRPGRDIVM